MGGARTLTWLLIALLAGQAGLGLLFPLEYRDPAWIVAAWYGNDWVTLLVAVPLLAAAGTRARVSLRALLLWLGGLGYALYNSAYYMLGASLNSFFPLYVAGVIVATAALILALGHVEAPALAAGFRAASGTLTRTVGAYYVFVGIGLSIAWLAMWAAHVFLGRPTPIEPDAFRLVAALDLTLLVPLMVAGGGLLWRGRPWGYVLASMGGTLGSLYLLVLTTSSVVAVQRELREPPGELPLWGSLALATIVVTTLLFAQARESSLRASGGA